MKVQPRPSNQRFAVAGSSIDSTMQYMYYTNMVSCIVQSIMEFLVTAIKWIK